MNAAIYARLSDTRQKNAPTLKYQITKCREFLESRGYSISDDAIYAEPEGHRSGRHISQRPAMQKLTREMDKYQAIAFFEFSRFTRSVSFTNDFIPQADKKRIKVFDAASGDVITMDTANEYIKANIKSMFSEYESIAASDRMRNYYKRARTNNWVYHRNAPIGLRIVGSRQDRHFERAGDFAIVLKIFKLLARGHTPSEIANELAASVRVQGGKMVKLQEYHIHGIVGNLAMYKPFIAAETWNAARRRTRERTPTGRARPLRHPSLMLAHIATCADCGRLFTATWDRETTTGALVAVYRHSIDAICPNRHKVRARKIYAQGWVVLDQLEEQLTKHNLANEVAANLDDAPMRDLAVERAELEKQLRTAKDHLLHERITPADFDEFAKEVGDKLAVLGKENTPTAKLSNAEIKLIAESAAGWRKLAQTDPREWNLLCRDVFSRVAIRQDNTLVIELAPAFRALGVSVPG